LAISLALLTDFAYTPNKRTPSMNDINLLDSYKYHEDWDLRPATPPRASRNWPDIDQLAAQWWYEFGQAPELTGDEFHETYTLYPRDPETGEILFVDGDKRKPRSLQPNVYKVYNHEAGTWKRFADKNVRSDILLRNPTTTLTLLTGMWGCYRVQTGVDPADAWPKTGGMIFCPIGVNQGFNNQSLRQVPPEWIYHLRTNKDTRYMQGDFAAAKLTEYDEWVAGQRNREGMLERTPTTERELYASRMISLFPTSGDWRFSSQAEHKVLTIAKLRWLSKYRDPVTPLPDFKERRRGLPVANRNSALYRSWNHVCEQLDVYPRWRSLFQYFWEGIGDKPDDSRLLRFNLDYGWWPGNCGWVRSGRPKPAFDEAAYARAKRQVELSHAHGGVWRLS
jgi:hypothetical protein